jgi:molybdenum cofactor cytidylyltransferase
VAAILLAAGESARLGRPKQLLPFRGRTLLRHAAETAVASGCEHVYVVLGAGHDRARLEVDGLALHAVVNAEWREGMGASIRCGLRTAMQRTGGLVGAMLLLADQPLVTPDHLRRMLATFRRTPMAIVAAHCHDHASPPAVFEAALFPLLLALNGAQGARRVIAAMPNDTMLFDLPEAAFDLDTSADYALLPGA